MALSYKSVMISLLVVFTVVAPNLQPSAAIRSAEGEAAGESHHVAVAPAPAQRGSAQVNFFLTPDFPCLPFLPKILIDLCHVLFPPPTPSPPSPPEPEQYCGPLLTKNVVPSCAAFLTNASESAPSKDCCAGMHTFIGKGPIGLCLCHVANGDVGRILPAPVVNQTRGIDALVVCIGGFVKDIVPEVCDPDSSTFHVPPMDPPSSPQSTPPATHQRGA